MKLFLSLALMMSAQIVWAYGTGYSSHPLWTDQHMVSGEMVGVTSQGGGVGLQARYTRKVSKKITLDAGAGLGGGARSNRFFAGGDLELFPDYMQQPRISLRSMIESASEADKRRTILSIAPTVSKGISFWGYEAYPFLALPVGLNLTGKDNTYKTQISASLGITGSLPFEDLKHLLGNIETQVGLRDSFTAVFLGVSLPLE